MGCFSRHIWADEFARPARKCAAPGSALSWSHSQAHFFRAILESVAFEYAYYLRILRELLPGLQLTAARVAGGGARGAAWNQLKADVLGVPYLRLAGNEFGTWGAAMIAGKAAGLIDHLADHATKTAYPDGLAVQPDLERHLAYQPLVERYIQMESILNRLFYPVDCINIQGAARETSSTHLHDRCWSRREKPFQSDHPACSRWKNSLIG